MPPSPAPESPWTGLAEAPKRRRFLRGPFTGWHMTAIMTAFFGVVIAVNVGMARLATGTFTGEVVENSYVASQQFNTWLDKAAQDRALGWKAEAVRGGDGRVMVTLAGLDEAALAHAAVRAEAREPLGRAKDRALGFTAFGGGRFVSAEALPRGRWTLRLTVSAGGHDWHGEVPVS